MTYKDINVREDKVKRYILAVIAGYGKTFLMEYICEE